METPDQKAAKHRYYLAHKDEFIARAKKWQALNPEKSKESMAKGRAKYDAAHKDELKVKHKIYYEKNKEAIRKKQLEIRRAKGSKPRIKFSKEEKKERAKAMRLADKGKALERAKEYYQKNKNRISAQAKEKRVSTKKTPGQVLRELREQNNSNTYV